MFREEKTINSNLHLFMFFRSFIKKLSDIVNGEHSETVFGNQPNPNVLATPAIQHGLAHFSLVGNNVFISLKFKNQKIN